MSRELNHKLCIVFAVFMLVLFSATASVAETITYSYDSLHRLIGVEYSDGTTVEYVYDAAGNQVEGTVVDPDADDDGVPDVSDNCPTTANANQLDTDEDDVGDACDNCVSDANSGQEDCNTNDVGDACDPINPTADDSDCDGIDDDCDDTPDDDYTPTPTSCGLGVCSSTGQMVCSNGELDDTCTPGSPTGTDDDCDGVDEDCDGVADDEYVPTGSTECGVGECESTGTVDCVGGQVVDTCTPGSPSDELCDGLDNDCDGSVEDDGADETWLDDPTTCGFGECESEGVLICDEGLQEDTCEEGTPSTEICDDELDNDCDEDTDCDDADCDEDPPCPTLTERSATFYILTGSKEDTSAQTGPSYNENDYTNGTGNQFFGYLSSITANAYWRWALDNGDDGETDGIAIPADATITTAYIKIRSDFANSGSLTEAFRALVTDDKWETYEAFSTTNYANGVSLNAITRQGTAVTWEITSSWSNGTVYTSPDITDLLQARIDDADYDPGDAEDKYFGLVLYHVSGTCCHRRGTQEPDTAATAELYVEWEETAPPDYEEATFNILNNDAEDTFTKITAGHDENKYDYSSGNQYFGYYNSMTFNAYWRWALDDGYKGETDGIEIPEGATILEAYVKIRSDYTYGGSFSAAFQALTTDNKWETTNGFNTTNYANATALNGISRQGSAVTWNLTDAWINGTVFASPDITDLLQARIDDADYDPTDSEDKFFGMVLYWVSGSNLRAGTQEPDDDSYTAELHVKWENP